MTITASGNQIVQIASSEQDGEDFTVTNVETIDATNSAAGNELRAYDETNTWLIDTGNGGSVAGVDFTNFANLVGGSNDDTFTISATVTRIETGDGTNEVTVNSGGSISVALTGGSNDDTFTIEENAAVTSIDTGDGVNNVTVNSDGSISDSITGGDGVDTVTINGSAGSIDTGANDDAITIGGTVSGVIDGGSGVEDVLTIT
ncbi:MAG: hypothetical protein GY822_12655, partial [Deltaproteobacteria bacterium]|nr:hypothetical protein [Deltaproteobacteria bacterium]